MKEYITPQMINSFLTLVVIPFLGVLTKYIISLIGKKIDEIDTRIKNENISKYMYIAENAVSTSVIAVNQVFVDKFKKSRTFDQSAKEEAFVMAKQRALRIMGDTCRDVLQSMYIDCDTWIDNKIEYYVNMHKSQ